MGPEGGGGSRTGTEETSPPWREASAQPQFYHSSCGLCMNMLVLLQMASPHMAYLPRDEPSFNMLFDLHRRGLPMDVSIASTLLPFLPKGLVCYCLRTGGGWVGLGQGLAWSPTHGPRRLPCGTRLGGRTRVSGHKAYRTVDRPQTPRWRSRAGDAAVPVCMCPCVSEGGGGGLWHTCLLHCCSALARGSVCLVLQAPAGRLESLTLSPPGEMWAWARNLHVTRTCYPTTPRLPIGTGRRWYVARLGSDPHSLTALGTGGAASRAGSGSHGRGRTLGRWRGTRAQSVLPCPGCHQCWLHWLRRYSPRRRGGPEGTTPEWPLR